MDLKTLSKMGMAEEEVTNLGVGDGQKMKKKEVG